MSSGLKVLSHGRSGLRKVSPCNNLVFIIFTPCIKLQSDDASSAYWLQQRSTTDNTSLSIGKDLPPNKKLIPVLIVMQASNEAWVTRSVFFTFRDTVINLDKTACSAHIYLCFSTSYFISETTLRYPGLRTAATTGKSLMCSNWVVERLLYAY